MYCKILDGVFLVSMVILAVFWSLDRTRLANQLSQEQRRRAVAEFEAKNERIQRYAAAERLAIA